MGFLTKIISLLKGNDKKGQHAIEYAVLMILVMAGIITMGPYVTRSWNANVKGWEDSVIDSMEDPMIESSSIPYPAECSIDEDWHELGCGQKPENVCPDEEDLICESTEMTWIRTFTPLSCQCALEGNNPTVDCRPDASCCESPVRVGCNEAIGSGKEAPPPESSTGGLDLDPPIDTGCPLGSMGYSINCGDNTYYGCTPDDECVPYCESQELAVDTVEELPLVSFDSVAVTETQTVACPDDNYTGNPTRECEANPGDPENPIWGDLQEGTECVANCGYCSGTYGVDAAEPGFCEPGTPSCNPWMDSSTCSQLGCEWIGGSECESGPGNRPCESIMDKTLCQLGSCIWKDGTPERIKNCGEDFFDNKEACEDPENDGCTWTTTEIACNGDYTTTSTICVEDPHQDEGDCPPNCDGPMEDCSMIPEDFCEEVEGCMLEDVTTTIDCGIFDDNLEMCEEESDCTWGGCADICDPNPPSNIYSTADFYYEKLGCNKPAICPKDNMALRIVHEKNCTWLGLAGTQYSVSCGAVYKAKEICHGDPCVTRVAMDGTHKFRAHFRVGTYDLGTETCDYTETITKDVPAAVGTGSSHWVYPWGGSRNNEDGVPSI